MSTTVKEVGSAFMNLVTPQTGKSSQGAVNFQNVWNNQMNKGAMGNLSQDSAAAARKESLSGERLQRGSSLKAKESQTVQNDGGKAEELSPEEQAEAMEALNTASLQMMQEIADAFGITVEELQAAMDGMGMEQTDVLDASKLGGLLLTLSGAEDSCALVTDGELYEKYRMLMGELDGALQQCADDLGVEQNQLLALLKEGFGRDVSAEETTAVRQPEGIQEAAGQAEETVQEEPASAVDPAESALQKEQEAQDRGGSHPEGERHSEGRSDKSQQPNIFLQDLRTQQFQPGVQQAESTVAGSPWSENTQEIMDQILDYMKLQLNADATNLEMQLHPASLGTLQIQLASKAGVVTANFIAQNEAVKAALETQMVQLKEQFEEQGIKVESIEVTVQTHEFERNLDEQGRGRDQQQTDRKGRSRRVSLSDPIAAESAEEEDSLAAEVRAAGGSTVDYAV